MAKYSPPKILKKWTHDIPGSELYELFVQDDRTVWSAAGRFAHSSVATHCTWEQFLDGRLDDLAIKTVGPTALAEAKHIVWATLASSR